MAEIRVGGRVHAASLRTVPRPRSIVPDELSKHFDAVIEGERVRAVHEQPGAHPRSRGRVR